MRELTDGCALPLCGHAHVPALADVFIIAKVQSWLERKKQTEAA